MSIPENIDLNCPTWCTADHTTRHSLDMELGMVGHFCEVGRMSTTNSAALERDVVVQVALSDVKEDGRSAPEILVDVPDDLTPVEARKLAGLLVDASAVAELPVPPAPVIEWPAEEPVGAFETFVVSSRPAEPVGSDIKVSTVDAGGDEMLEVATPNNDTIFLTFGEAAGLVRELGFLLHTRGAR